MAHFKPKLEPSVYIEPIVDAQQKHVFNSFIEFILVVFHSIIKIIAQCVNNEKINFLLVQLPNNIYK